MNRRTNSQILDAVAGDFIVDQTNIAPKIMAVAVKENHLGRAIRISQYAFVSLMVALALLILSVPGVTSAMRQWFGFLPGVGMVDQAEPVRVLQEPVSLARGGITVQVRQVYALPDRTVIQYSVSGIPESAYPQNLPGSDTQGYKNACVEPIFLRLPDDKTLTYTGFNAVSGTRNVSQYEQQFTVQPVPADTDSVTLVMPCIDGTERDAIPGSWELPLKLVRATEQAQIIPVYSVSTIAPAVTETLDPAKPSSGTPSGEMPETAIPADGAFPAPVSQPGIRITVDQVIPLPNGDEIIYGKVQWDDQTPYSAVELDQYEIVDAQGQRVPYDLVSPDMAKMPAPGDRFVPFAFQIKGAVEGRGPLSLKVHQMHANAHYQETGFTLDTGAAPSNHQQWQMNQDIQVGQYLIRVLTTTRLANGYEFTFETDPTVGCVDVYIPGANQVRVQCGKGMTKIEYDGPVPTGIVRIGIANLDVTLPGDWQATWQTPEITTQGK
jgi:hypothetical protein